MSTITVGSKTMSLRQGVDLLGVHLQAIVAVEFFTIPVYMTAVYCFTNNALALVDPDATGTEPAQPLMDMQQRVLSVAIQEMYHLQLASNLCKALGVTPEIPQLTLTAGTPIPVPHLNNVTIPKLGTLPEMLGSMIGIEAPDPAPDYPMPNETATYDSISDLYHATAYLVGLVATAVRAGANDTDVPPFDGNKQVAYGTFKTTYQWNTIPQGTTSAVDSAIKLINAITDQGEGKNVVRSPLLRSLFGALSASGADAAMVDPEFQPAAQTRFSAYGAYTHETRFQQVQATLWSKDFAFWNYTVRAQYKSAGYDAGIFYAGDGTVLKADAPAWALDPVAVQSAVNVFWSCLTNTLQTGIASGQLSETYPAAGTQNFTFTDVMYAFKYALQILWRDGSVPSFTYTGQVTEADVQNAFDLIDPYCLVHWDEITRKLRAEPSFVQNVCQGLNTTAGQGWGGTGTAKGGDCACNTADIHSCGGGNTCTGRGACGYLSTKPSADPKGPTEMWPANDQFAPGMNDCTGRGGCQTPISTLQRFDHSPGVATLVNAQTWDDKTKAAILALQGGAVWEQARTLHGWSTTPPPRPPQPAGAGNTDYDGLKRRTAVQPTST